MVLLYWLLNLETNVDFEKRVRNIGWIILYFLIKFLIL